MDKLKQIRQELEAMQYVLHEIIAELDELVETVESYDDDGE